MRTKRVVPVEGMATNKRPCHTKGRLVKRCGQRYSMLSPSRGQSEDDLCQSGSRRRYSFQIRSFCM